MGVRGVHLINWWRCRYEMVLLSPRECIIKIGWGRDEECQLSMSHCVREEERNSVTYQCVETNANIHRIKHRKSGGVRE